MLECVAALCHTRHGNLETAVSEGFSAASDTEAKDIALNWARTFDFVADDVVLRINVDRCRVYILRRNEFSAVWVAPAAPATERERGILTGILGNAGIIQALVKKLGLGSKR